MATDAQGNQIKIVPTPFDDGLGPTFPPITNTADVIPPVAQQTPEPPPQTPPPSQTTAPSFTPTDTTAATTGIVNDIVANAPGPVGYTAPEAPTAPVARDIPYEQTTRGILDEMLSGNSVGMQAATSDVNARLAAQGLGGWGGAEGVAQKARAEYATPVATADASAYERAGLSAQEAGQDLTRTGYQGDISAGLTTQQAGNELNTLGTQGAINAALTSAELNLRGSIDSGLNNQTAWNNLTAIDQKAFHDSAALRLRGDIDSGLQSQAAWNKLNEIDRLALHDTAAKSQNLHDQVSLDMLRLDSADKEAFSSATSTIMTNYNRDLTTIQTSGKTPEEQRIAISNLNTVYRPQINFISDIYDYATDWTSDEIVPAAGGNTDNTGSVALDPATIPTPTGPQDGWQSSIFPYLSTAPGNG